MSDERFKELALQKQWRFNYKGKLWFLPRESGVYLLVFKNGKRYFGSTNNLNSRIIRHLGALSGKNKDSTKWYKLAREDNNLPFFITNEKDEKALQRQYFQFLRNQILSEIKLSYCLCADYGWFEDQLLGAIEDKDMWYNTQFYGNNKRGNQK